MRFSARTTGRIRLAAWAATTAEELHQRFGADVELTMGALRYPQRTPAGSPGQSSRAAQIDTSGALIADVVNPRTGAVTGATPVPCT